MFIEKIIEFELRGPEPLGRTVHAILKLVIFMTKTKTSEESKSSCY